MPIQRVALIFDAEARPETTGIYCRRALGTFVQVEHFLPTELSRIPRTGFDLYLQIDDGLEYRHPEDLRPSAWWAIDTHMNFDWCRTKAADFDFVFAAQRDGAERLRGEGIASAAWLPLACDPELHRKQDVPKQFDVCFVGSLFPGPREELVRLLQRHLQNTFVGRRYFEEMAQVFSASRIVFNRSIKNDINMRVFEALASGSLLLTNDLHENGQEELFQDGIHLATYRQAEELLDKARFYLQREEARERIAAAGHQEALSRHTYQHRMEHILREIEKRLAKTVLRGVTAPVEFVRRPPAEAAKFSAAPAGARDPSYFEFSRPEILALIPESVHKILDIGCGAGRLGEALKARQPAEVIGIEIDPQAARAAEGRLDRVLVGDIETMEPDIPAGSLDAIVCGDVLEHLRDPAALLRRARAWLRPDGQLIASIPNVRHHTVLCGLLEGDWTYKAAGLLDKDHVRFFTRREIEKLFYRAGFLIQEIRMVPGPGDEQRLGERHPGEVRVGRLHIGGMPPEEAEEFYTYQYLVRAVPAPAPDFGLTSIVIVTHNQLDYTRQCLESIRHFTDERCELIVVDNASSDETVEYLRSLPDARILVNKENRGFPAAANQGIRVTSGEQILLLNNDTVVTTGWLRRLLRALHSDPAVGLVGPCSNFVSGEQQVAISYDDLAGLDGFAWEWGKIQDGAIIATDRLVGFCLLVRRKVVDRIGLLDERFGIGCFEDDDYCLRALQAGFRVVVARDAFVHHFGGRTFLGSQVDLAALMKANQEVYRLKWESQHRHEGETRNAALGERLTGGIAASDGSDDPANERREVTIPRYELHAAPGGGLLLQQRPVRLSLCMIVRDNAGTIEACLKSIQPWVDEMVVVDTGSKDQTPQIAQSLGAHVYYFPWCDDFAAARNESLKYARGEWIFWMDSDDTIDSENGRRLRELAMGTSDPSVLGYVMQVHCPGPNGDASTDVTVVDHVKLVRNRPDLRFEHRIHEQILPAIRRAGGEVAFTDVFLSHSHADHSDEGRKAKLDRDFRLLRLELQERPEHPFVLFNLGMTHADAGEHQIAIDMLERSIGVAKPEESHLRKAYSLLIGAYCQLGRHGEAWRVCQEGRQQFPDDAELLFREGVLHHHFGRLTEAEQSYRCVLDDHGSRHFSSIDRGIRGFKTRHNLALVYEDMGDLPMAEEQWRKVVAEASTYRLGWRGLVGILLRQGKLDAAEQQSRALCAEATRPTDVCIEGLMLSGRVAVARGALAEAERLLRESVARSPDDLDARHVLCQLLFEHGDLAEAEAALKDLLRRIPDDGAAYHNLGTICLMTGRPELAADAYQRSLALRPNSSKTYLNLGNALQDLGRFQEAVAAWEQAARLDPTDPEAVEALRKAAESHQAPARKKQD